MTLTRRAPRERGERLCGFLRPERSRLVLKQLVGRDAEQIAEDSNRVQFQRDDFAVHEAMRVRGRDVALGQLPPRTAPLPRSGIKRRGRKPSETARIYGGVKRINWIKSLPCCWCGVYGRSENAHTVTGGTGRKADASTIVPLCGGCHRAYDRHLAPFDAECCREGVRMHAMVIERQWQARCAA